MSVERITIAIDGYSSCGKSTVAKALAKKLGYIYIDSGAMYRAVTFYCMQHKIISDGKFSESEVLKAINNIHLSFHVNPLTHVSEIHLNGVNVEKDIRGMDVSEHVSPISTIKGVREKIVGLQKEFGKNKGIVMDGRDIGTNVFPDAELKIFMTADPVVRAQRRWEELKEKGMDASLDDVKKNIELRDYEDTHRAHNPLRKAEDAVVLDNTLLNLDQQLAFAEKLVDSIK
ncbi:MAG: (d)CMP kinase [Bacteroidetes bacterium]|nr:(d)CMP kinase [Bacteroidota bacterium]